MSEVPPGLRPGLRLECILADGTVVTGVIERAAKGWLRVQTSTGPVLVHLTHVALIKPGDAEAAGIGLGSQEDSSPTRGSSRGAPAASADWSPEQLRALADGLLDGHTDTELAARLGQRKAHIVTLRQAFECARGNMVDDEIPPAARVWISRWREVLSS